MSAVVAQKLAPFTFFVTSAPSHIEAHLAAHLPLWDDEPARAAAIQDIAGHINGYFPQADPQREAVICVTNEMEQLQSEAPHFLYDISAQCVVSEENGTEGLLLRISFFDADVVREDSETVPLAQWQKDAYRTILQIMAETSQSAKTLPVLRGVLSNLSRLQFLLLAKKSGTKWHDVDQIMSRADLQVAIALSVDGVRQSLSALCISQTVSSTSQIKIRGRLNKLEGIRRLQLRTSPRAATIVNTRNSVQKLMGAKPAPVIPVKRSSRVVHVEQAASPRVMRSFKASAVTPFARHVAKAKSVTQGLARTMHAFIDFKRATNIVLQVPARNVNTIKPDFIVPSVNAVPGQPVAGKEKSPILIKGPVSPQPSIPSVIDPPIINSAPVKEIQPNISGSPEIAVKAMFDPVQIIPKTVAASVAQPLMPQNLQAPIGSNDALSVETPTTKNTTSVVQPVEDAAHTKANAVTIAAQENATVVRNLVEHAITPSIVAAIPAEISHATSERLPVIPATSIAVAIPQALQLQPAEADKLKPQESSPVAEAIKLSPPIETTPAPVLPEPVAASVPTIPVAEKDPAASMLREAQHHNLAAKTESLPLASTDNVVLLNAPKPADEAGGDPELARLKRLKKARQYTQYGMC